MAYVDRVNDVWRVTCAATYPNGQVQEFNVHMQIAAAGAGDSRLQMLAAVNAGITGNVLSHMGPGTAFIGSRASPVITQLPYSPVIATVNAPGTQAGTTLPTAVRVVISWRTDLVGKLYRGRIYGFTPGAADQSTSGHPTQALMDAWGLVALTFKNKIVAGGTTWEPVVYHRRKQPADPFINPTIITGAQVQPKWGTQHRSGDYGRPNIAPW